jgi:uncharacterized YigZ family protein
MDYRTVFEPQTASITEKKSEFIASLVHCESEDEAVAHIDDVRSRNRKARHNCYAYILRQGSTSRYSDDAEPQGTAGIPILEVLKKEELYDVCVVVTRYFGGILLGTGGLARAYSGAAALCCRNADIVTMRMANIMEFECDYSLYGSISRITEKPYIKTVAADFSDNVSMKLCVAAEYVNDLEKELVELSNGRIYVNVGQEQYERF